MILIFKNLYVYHFANETFKILIFKSPIVVGLTAYKQK